MKLNSTFLIALALFCSSILNAQQLAFPTAEGAGRFTTGGRGTPSIATTVLEVTNLNDDNLPGSLRYAVSLASSSAPYRTIVFRISGTIHLTSALSINRANTTIAGQTAPGDGICLADYPVSIGADNVIVRYMRFRMGDKNQKKVDANGNPVNGSGGDDAFGALGRNHIIVDHCTMSWSDDEALTVYRGDSTTLQWNIMSEPLNYSYHFETGDADYERHGYGGIWGGRHASFHHNLFAHVQGRVPRFDGSRNLPNSSSPVIGSENGDFRNNVLYNWGAYNTNGGEGGNYNIVNNYYKYGPSTSTNVANGVSVRSMIINPYKQSSPALPYGKYYVTGNFVEGNQTITDNNWRGAAMNGGSLADTVQSKVDVPFDLGPVNTQAAIDAYETVLQDAGCTKPNRDTLDQRIVNDVRNRTGRIIDVQGGYPHGTPYDQTVNAWPSLNSTTPPADTDHDGMPDTWENANGLDPNNAADRNTYAANGYTALENYLNSITSSALPLNLLSFKAVNSGKDIETSWSTSNEINTQNFVVEKSRDGRTFTTITTVKANNSGQKNTYSFRDQNPFDGISFYRLKMVDRDGSFTYSALVRLNRLAKTVLSINPNPVVDKLTISHPVDAGASIKILSLDGKSVKTVKVGAGSSQTIINTSLFSSGLYYVIFETETEKVSAQFVKK